MVTCWLHTKIDINFNDLDKHKTRKPNVLPIPLPSAFVWDLPRMVWHWLEEPNPLCPRTPEQMYLHRINLYYPPPTVQQRVGLAIQGLHPTSQWHLTRTFGYKTGLTVWRRTVDPPSSPVETTMAQQHVSFKTIISDPHLNLSAHTFTRYTLPFDKISSVLDLLASDKVATHDLLALDQINQSIVALEFRLDEHHQLAALKFSSLLWHPIAQQLPQQIHNIQHPDCGHCQLWHRQPTPFRRSPARTNSSPSSSPSSSSSSTRRRYRQMLSYPRPSNPIPSTSANTSLPFPLLTTRSSRVYPQNYFEANAKDCLHCLQTVPEERRWGTSHFPIFVEAPEVEDDIFQRYYQWFINEGRD